MRKLFEQGLSAMGFKPLCWALASTVQSSPVNKCSLYILWEDIKTKCVVWIFEKTKMLSEIFFRPDLNQIKMNN